MITSFSVKNFRSLKNEAHVELKPITILCGVNSCGKTSIIKSLLLLKQTIESEDTNNAITLNGPYQVAQKLKDLLFIFRRQEDNSLTYTFKIENEKKELGNISFSIRPFSPKNKEQDNILSNFEIKDTNGNFFKISRNSNGNYVPESNIDLKLGLPPEISEKVDETIVILQKFLPNILFYKSKNNKNMLSVPLFVLDVVGNKKSDLYETLKNFRDSIQKISYLGPLRASPQLAYLQFSDSNTTLDDSGSNCAQILWKHGNDKIQFNKQKMNLLDALKQTFELLGINHSIEVTRKDIVYSIGVNVNNKSKQTVPITDVGFGVSQLLPVILKGLLGEKESLIVLEQPEIHLHPSCKANLADLFIAWARDGQRMLVETHSTELIDRLRLRIIENPELKDIINIIFVSLDETCEEGSSIQEIHIDEMGVPLKWPSGFCDESTKQAEQIIFARVKKQETSK